MVGACMIRFDVETGAGRQIRRHFMLRHMIVAHSVMKQTQPNLDAHAKLNCAYQRSGSRISDFLQVLAHYAGFSAFGGKGH